MDKNQFYTLLKNPGLLLYADKFEFEKITREYPWFSSAYLLLAKKMEMEKHPEFTQRLNFIASQVADRQRLYELVHGISRSEPAHPAFEPALDEALMPRPLAPQTPVVSPVPEPVPEERPIAAPAAKAPEYETPAIQPAALPPVPEIPAPAPIPVAAQSVSASDEALQEFREKLKEKAQSLSEAERMMEQNREIRRRFMKQFEEEEKKTPAPEPVIDSTPAEPETMLPWNPSESDLPQHLPMEENTEETALAETHRENLSSIEIDHQLEAAGSAAIASEVLLSNESAGEAQQMELEEENEEQEDLQSIPVADEAQAAVSLEETFLDEKEKEENEFSLFSLVGGGEVLQGEVEEENMDELVEENESPEQEAILDVEQALLSREVTEMAKEQEMNLIGQSEFAHKDELTEPDDDRLFEEKFDTEMESYKTMEAETSWLRNQTEEEDTLPGMAESAVVESPTAEAPHPAHPAEAGEPETVESLSTQPATPLPAFHLHEKHTFTEWLQLLQANKALQKGNPETSITVNLREPEKESLGVPIEFTADHIQVESPEELEHIDKLVAELKQKNPENTIPAQKSALEKAEESVTENHEIITETLARVYAMQGKYAKAISIYSRLSLKFPEKSSYFAALINELKSKL